MCFRRAAFIHYERAVTSLVPHTCPSLSALSQVLGRFDMAEGYQNPSVAEEQAAVQVAPDGSSIMVYALGQNPTGWRTRPDEAWRWLEQGQSQVRTHSLWRKAGARASAVCLTPPAPLSAIAGAAIGLEGEPRLPVPRVGRVQGAAVRHVPALQCWSAKAGGLRRAAKLRWAAGLWRSGRRPGRAALWLDLRRGPAERADVLLQ